MLRNKLIYLFFLLVGLYLVVSLGRSIYSLSNKGKDIDDARKRVDEEMVFNNKLNQELQTAKSQQFIEQQARDKLNMSKKSETVVVVPKDLVEQIASNNSSLSASFFDHPAKVPNWQKWWRMFF